MTNNRKIAISFWLVLSLFVAYNAGVELYKAANEPPPRPIDKFLPEQTKTVKCMRNAMKKTGYPYALDQAAWVIFYPQCKPTLW